MSKMLKSWTWKQKLPSAFFVNVFKFNISSWKCFHKHDIYNLLYMIIHIEKTFKAMQCQNCRKYFKKKQEPHTHLQKSTWFFLVLSWSFGIMPRVCLGVHGDGGLSHKIRKCFYLFFICQCLFNKTLWGTEVNRQKIPLT